MKFTKSDEKFMRLALQLARKGMGRTSPNPMVGAVIVKGRTIVGKGYHHRAGQPHAEVLALRQAGEKARGATLYLNLEPCDHFGRTPPCTQAILHAGIKKVVVGMMDPNPLVSGRGIGRLRKKGVRVQVGLLREECRELNAPFIQFMKTGMPLVTLKAAVSLDGKVATRTGDSRWISGQEARNYVHRLRAGSDAVMTGIGTVLRDDPLLNVRLSGRRTVHQPLRVIVDSHLRLPFHSQLVQTAKRYPTLVATTRSAPAGKLDRLKKAHVDVVVMKKDSHGRVHLKALLRELGRRGVLSVLLEAGPTLNASALGEGLADRLILFLAPKIIGGEKSPGMIGGEGVFQIKDAWPVKVVKTERLGSDFLIEGRFSGKE